MQRFVYAWTPESTPRYTSFHKTRVSDPNSTLLEYLLYAAGVNPLVSGEKKYANVHARTCAKLFGNEMCVSINGNNGSAILGFFFKLKLTLTCRYSVKE